MITVELLTYTCDMVALLTENGCTAFNIAVFWDVTACNMVDV